MPKKRPEDYEKKIPSDNEKAGERENTEPMKTAYFKIPKSTYKEFQIFCIEHEIQKSDFCNKAFLEYMEKEKLEK
jgi:hypothetical protein